MGHRHQLQTFGPAALYAFLVLLPVSAPAQQPPNPRPKIGIALEGGGALGLAHIGVLQWFEEHRIPVDYVAGTSMGGLVGGLYATGMRPPELRQLITTIDWNETLGGKTPFLDLAYRRKEDQVAFQNDLVFGLRHGFNLPSGLASGQNINFFIDREVLPYSDMKSFDDLPIPFRCVATDLVSGKQFVFKEGQLGKALRSTMSVSGVFTPVRGENSIYADGGILNNLPVDVVKQMGADIVIAVYLNSDSFDPKSPQSLLSTLGRSVSVMTMANEVHNLENADLVISVDLKDYTTMDFDSADKIVPRGYEAAVQKSAVLARLSLNEADWETYLAVRDSRRIRSTPAPQFVRVNGVDEASSDEVEKTFAENIGIPVDTARIEREIKRVAGTGLYNSFSYGMAAVDGQKGLMVQADEKTSAPPFLNVGFFVDGSELDNVRFAMNARITAMNIGGYRSELRTDVSVGSIWGLASEYYRPLTATSRWFVAPRFAATNSPFDFYRRSEQIAYYRIGEVGGGFDLGYEINRSSEIRLGYDAGYLETKLAVGDPVLPTSSGRVGFTSIRYSLNQLDSPIIPRTGQFLRLQAQWDDTYPRTHLAFPLAEISFGVVRRVSGPGSVFVEGFAGSTFGYHDTGLPQFFVGGPTRLSAYGTNELRTDQYWLAKAGYIHELFRLPALLGNRVYATIVYEVAKAYDAPGASGLPTDGAAGFVMETLVGPLFIGGSYGDSGHHKVYFALGKFF